MSLDRERRRSLIISRQSGKILPDEYQQVEYLQSDGNQIIQTGISVDGQSKPIKMKIRTTSDINKQSVFGGTHFTSAGRHIYLDDGNVVLINTHYGSNPQTIATYSPNEWCEFTYQISSMVSVARTMAVFKANWDSGRNDLNLVSFIGDIAYIHFGDDFDYIPCYRKADNVPGMYDFISNTFKTNSGTGTFIVGPDVD